MLRFSAPFAHSRSRRPGQWAVVLAIALMVTGAGIQSQPVPAAGFVPGLEDVPLMAGLTLEPDRGFVFDKPDGRLVEAVATGRLAAADVTRFYADTLGQLGWRRQPDHTPDRPNRAKLVLRRGDEVLSISARTAGQGVVVRFSLAPG